MHTRMCSCICVSAVSPYVCITLKKLVRHQLGLSYEDIGSGRASGVCRHVVAHVQGGQREERRLSFPLKHITGVSGD